VSPVTGDTHTLVALTWTVRKIGWRAVPNRRVHMTKS
jgi:hypothetical protein